MKIQTQMLAIAAILLTACHKDKKEEPKQPDTQSVLVYIAGDNNLQDFIMSDIRQMMEGSKELTAGNNLLLFVDQKGKLPYLMKVEQSDTLRLMTYTTELKSSDANTLATAYRWMTENYEAKNYGLILWGHADGWIIEKARGPRHAYGQDTTGGEQWMNIPEMAQALSSLPHLRFIFADCCCFQSVESDYELRNVTDYIIASAAEIPGEGAPYHTVIPALFSQRDDFYQLAANAYYEQVSYGYQEPLSVVKTSEMENLALATRTALRQSLEMLDAGKAETYPDVTGLIYYYNQTLFDMQDFVLHHASEDVYTVWKSVFDRAVVFKTTTTIWMANFVPYLDAFRDVPQFFRDFEVTEERYGGVSMFVPQNSAASNIKKQNDRISQMQWYKAAGLDELGW